MFSNELASEPAIFMYKYNVCNTGYSMHVLGDSMRRYDFVGASDDSSSLG